jgi:aryl-phospho-beta-D-glucosidase BglC (GH1 family)
MFALNAQKTKFIYTEGQNEMLPDGKPFIMRGTNTGNWLVPEGYMFKFKEVNSPRLINQALSELIGQSAVDSFWNTYLASYITADDIHYMKSIGMNSIRVPFNFRLFTSEKYLGETNPNHGFEILDKLISWCKKEQLYVLLDMHCAPGGQTGDNIDDG